jgi:hypothetical protein
MSRTCGEIDSHPSDFKVAITSTGGVPPHVEVAGKRIGLRVKNGLRGVRESTESAAILIGKMLDRIVKTATSEDGDVRRELQRAIDCRESSDADAEPPIIEQLRSQSATVASFVDETRTFLGEQLDIAKSANQACENINHSATLVSNLMVRSRILSLNMQIEAARLGQHGAAFNVIAEEMKRFAAEVRNANESIKAALAELLLAVPKIEQRTGHMDDRMTEFSGRIETQLSTVEQRTQSLADCMRTALDNTEARNAAILGFSQNTLSALQFQDPAAQSLRRIEHDVSKLESLLLTGNCEDLSLAEIEDDVGEDGSQLREAGEIEMF